MAKFRALKAKWGGQRDLAHNEALLFQKVLLLLLLLHLHLQLLLLLLSRPQYSYWKEETLKQSSGQVRT